MPQYNPKFSSLKKASTKASLYRSLMRNPKTARALVEAMDAPIGSSARANAKRIFDVANRIHLREQAKDGMGGPGMMMQRQALSKQSSASQKKNAPEKSSTHTPTDNSKGLVCFTKIPKPMINYGLSPKKHNATASMWKARPSFDGVGGPGGPAFLMHDGQGGPTSGLIPPPSGITPTQDLSKLSLSPSPEVKFPSMTGGQSSSPFQFDNYAMDKMFPSQGYMPPEAPKPKPQLAGGALSSISSGVTTPKTTVSPFIQNVEKQQQLRGGDSSSFIQNLLNPQQKTGGVTGDLQFSVSSTAKPTLPAPYKKPAGPVKPAAGQTTTATVEGAAKTLPAGWTATAYANFKKANPKLEPTAVDTKDIAAWEKAGAGTAAGTTPAADETGAPTGTGTGDLSEIAPGLTGTYGAPGVQSAVNANWGDKAFSFWTMMDKNDPITGGKTMMEAYLEARDALKKMYGIEEAQDEVATLKEAGYKIQPDMEAWIRERDTAVKTYDDKINEAIAQMNKMDLSVGNNRQNMENYMNYLYTQKGRYTTRYAAYVENAKNQLETELKVSSDNLQSLLDAYKEDLGNAKEMTKDLYDKYSEALSSNYKAVDEAPDKILRRQAQMESILNARVNRALDLIKLKKEGEAMTYLDAITKTKGYLLDGNNRLQQGADYGETLSRFGPSIGYDNASAIFFAGLENVMNAPTGAKDGSGVLIDSDYKKKMLNDSINQISGGLQMSLQAMGAAQKAGDQDAFDTAANTFKTFYGALDLGKTGNKGTLLEMASRAQVIGEPELQSYKGALTSLSPDLQHRWYNPMTYWKDAPTKDEFIKNNEGVLDKDILSSIYDDYADSKMTPTDFAKTRLYANYSTSQRDPAGGTGAIQPFPDEVLKQDVARYKAEALLNQYIPTQKEMSLIFNSMGLSA